jgi:RNA polymerase sigma-70 factor (ECF subfamily)
MYGQKGITDTVNDANIELVKRAVEGDVEAYGNIYETYLDRIYSYVFYRVRNEMVTEDITEEIFVKAWNKIKTCRGKEHTFKSWLYRIAHNHIVDTFRKMKKDLPLESEDIGLTDSIEEKVELKLEGQQLLTIISALPKSQKEIILLKFVEGLNNREIEEITGKRQGAVRALQMRALTTLRKHLNTGVV